MATFDHEKYESLCAAMAFIDGAVAALAGHWSRDDINELNDQRNRMNDERLSVLAKFGKRVYHVDDVEPTP